jgi:hypothetical protein
MTFVVQNQATAAVAVTVEKYNWEESVVAHLWHVTTGDTKNTRTS